MSIPFLLGSSVSVTLVLAGNANDYPTNRLPPEVEVIKADSELTLSLIHISEPTRPY